MTADFDPTTAPGFDPASVDWDRADHDARLLRLIHDLQQPCTCPTPRRGHTDRDCPWYDLPDRASGFAKEAVQAQIERLHREVCHVDHEAGQ